MKKKINILEISQVDKWCIQCGTETQQNYISADACQEWQCTICKQVFMVTYPKDDNRNVRRDL